MESDREPPGSQSNPKGWHSRGYIPHYDSPECVQHVVFRCADSLPPKVWATFPLQTDERRREVDRLLDRAYGACPLRKPAIADAVSSTIMHYRESRYRLVAWCIMPNHVHVALEVLSGHRLGDVVRQWKSFSARRINAVLGTTGPFWARDYFDRYMRNEAHLAMTIAYIEANPVNAGLVLSPQLWRWSSAHDPASEPGGSRSK